MSTSASLAAGAPEAAAVATLTGPTAGLSSGLRASARAYPRSRDATTRAGKAQVRHAPQPSWDRLSSSYDRQLWLERAALSAVVTLLAPRPHERCLDVATGTGALLRRLAALPRPPGRAVGIDASPAMLARVGALPHGWSVQVADARALPFADGTFEAASAAYLLHLLDDRDLGLVLAELARVLAPGGRLVTVTPAIPPRGLARPLAIACDRLATRRPGRFGALRALDTRPALEQAGLSPVAWRWTALGYPSIVVLAQR